MSTMLRISEAASLALHTMAVLAREPEKVHSTHDVAVTLGVSEAHLAKVMQRLTRAGLVKSVRGPKGGFLIGRATGDVTLLEVYEAIEGPLVTRTCLLGKPACDGTHCILGNMLGRVTSEMKDYLARTKLSDLNRVERERAALQENNA